MNKLLYKNPDNTVCVVIPNSKRKICEALKIQELNDLAVSYATRPEDYQEDLDILTPLSPEERYEWILNKVFPDSEYKQHVISKSIPDGVNHREITNNDLPPDREFRNAWVDVTPESRVDICCTRAKEIKLAELRAERNKLLDETDKEFTRALEEDDQVRLDELRANRTALRDATEPLKALNTTDKYNDDELLNEIKTKSKINNLIAQSS